MLISSETNLSGGKSWSKYSSAACILGDIVSSNPTPKEKQWLIMCIEVDILLETRRYDFS